jgi:glycerophosphoryl diester phosphodiesterase
MSINLSQWTINSIYGIVSVSLASFIFERYPSLLHGKESSEKRLGRQRMHMQCIGHRGCKLEGIPENSMLSFHHALEQKMDCLELDVRMTKDRRVVVFHDSNFVRMTNGKHKGSVETTNYEDLPDLVPGPSEQQHQMAVHPQKIPLFKDVLTLLSTHSDTTMIVEFKEDNRELVEEVHRMIIASGAKDRVFWFSLRDVINRKLKDFDPSIPRITGVIECLTSFLLYYMGILPFLSLNFSVFGITADELPYTRLRGETALKAVPDWILKVVAFFVSGSPPWLLASHGMISYMQRRGIPVWFMGVNETQHVDAALRLGANAVLTDKPKWLSKHMKLNNMTFKPLESDNDNEDKAL